MMRISCTFFNDFWDNTEHLRNEIPTDLTHKHNNVKPTSLSNYTYCTEAEDQKTYSVNPKDMKIEYERR